MKNGYLGELDARCKELSDQKVALEANYMLPIDDQGIMADEATKLKFMDAVNGVDDLAQKLTVTAKSVSTAIDSWFSYMYLYMYTCIYMCHI